MPQSGCRLRLRNRGQQVKRRQHPHRPRRVLVGDDDEALDRVAQEGYTSVSEYFHELIREAQRRQAKLELEAKLAEGLQGSPVRMTRKDWQATEREALDGLADETLAS